MFTLKKIVSGLLLPLPISLILLILGLILLAWTRARKTGITCISFGVLILAVFSINPVSSTLITGLEKHYQPLVTLPNNIKYIVVLGGGNGGSKKYPPNTQLSSASLARLTEAIRLHRQDTDSFLVLSGGRVFGSRADANEMNNAAIALGVRREQMIIESGSRDTVEEATYLKSIVKNKPFVLVTSAYHMPRAMLIFKQLGMKPIPAPTQFMTSHHVYNPRYYLPSIANLVYSDIALHEYLGIAWLKITSMNKTDSITLRSYRPQK